MRRIKDGHYLSSTVRLPWRLRWLRAVVALVVGLVAGFAVGRIEATADPESWAACDKGYESVDGLCMITAPSPVPPGAPLPTQIPHDGLYWVGQDIAPGRYYSPGVAPSAGLGLCEWAAFDRAGKFVDGDKSDGPQYIPPEPGRQVPEGVMIETTGCAPWVRK